MSEAAVETYYPCRDGGPVSSVRVVTQGEHARITIWNRGGLAGELVVLRLDAAAYVEMLTGQRRRAVWERLVDDTD
jgi:hypothetical protein